MRKRIAIIDDDEAIAELIALILEDAGYSAWAISDSAKALQELRTYRPDLVLLDLMMPGIDGNEVLREMAADAYLAGVPVIVISARPDAREDVAGQGGRQVREVLTKPFEFDVMLAAVTRALR